MEEAVRLVKSMWTEKRTTFQGKYFQAQDAILEPKPIQKPHPPIMIGGGGEQKTLRLVARYADASNVFGGPETIHHKYEVLRAKIHEVERQAADLSIEFERRAQETIEDLSQKARTKAVSETAQTITFNSLNLSPLKRKKAMRASRAPTAIDSRRMA